MRSISVISALFAIRVMSHHTGNGPNQSEMREDERDDIISVVGGYQTEQRLKEGQIANKESMIANRYLNK